MKRKRPFNRRIIRSNISEAIEELCKIEKKAADGTITEIELQVWLCHAYSHLNFAWNVRRISTSEYRRLTQQQFEQWGKYPAEITDL